MQATLGRGSKSSDLCNVITIADDRQRHATSTHSAKTPGAQRAEVFAYIPCHRERWKITKIKSAGDRLARGIHRYKRDATITKIQKRNNTKKKWKTDAREWSRTMTQKECFKNWTKSHTRSKIPMNYAFWENVADNWLSEWTKERKTHHSYHPWH